MLHELIFAGFGGQGVMSMGQLVTYAGMMEGYNVSWLPSYGPEQRGGTANCSVIITDDQVGAPVVTNPTTAIVLNNPSFDKFEPTVTPGGTLIINTSLVNRKSNRTDIQVIEINANEIANELGNGRVANMVLLGAFIEMTQVFTIETLMEALKKVLPKRHHHLLSVNQLALEKGMLLYKEQSKHIPAV